jgi:betaine-aldehyde dehydrogenase
MSTAITNFIDGDRVAAADGRTSDLVDPSTGDVFATAPVSGQADLDAAFKSARAGFEAWRDATPGERQRALLRIADAIEERADELVAVESQNTGKPRELTASEEVPPMCDQIRFFAGAARVLEGRSAGEYMQGYTSYVRREPVGVCAAVTPWNYPAMMAVWKWAPALAAGNAMVLKPSDTTPASTVWMAELMSEFLPAGVFNVVCGDRGTGAALVSHPTPAMVSITGSVGAGIAVAKAAADDVKRVHLELGGKAPVIVFDDADLELAAENIAIAGYFNAGQDCTAATRVLAGPRIHDDFVAALSEQARNTRTGPPDDGEVLYGPLNNANQLAHVSGLVERAPEHATVVAGGRRQGDRGFFYEPTVVDGLHQDDELIQNEVFGPVITVQGFDDEDKAIEWANGVDYALASSVWTEDHGRALRVSRRLDFGCVWINCHIPLVAEMPHGGYKKSGYGKDLSMYGLEDYTRIKHVMSYIERRDG